MVPPPAISGDRLVPWRARPVFFCANGFLAAAADIASLFCLMRALPLVRHVRPDRHIDCMIVRLYFEDLRRSVMVSARLRPILS